MTVPLNQSKIWRTFASTYGPAIFELVPYAVIDNAIKYAPNRSNIIVQVEDRARDIQVTVASLGPLITPPERVKIFERGYRGLHATQMLPSGTGIGLHTTRELLRKHFNGSIEVIQDATPSVIDHATYFSTQFEIVVPRHV